MIEIAELPDSLRENFAIIKYIPELSYVTKMSEKLCPDVGLLETKCIPELFLQGGTCIFLNRYFGGLIDTSFKVAYQSHSDLQKTLEIYNIDPTAFWYLVLFLKDYVDDESKGMKKQENGYTELTKLVSKLYAMNFHEFPPDGKYQGCENSGVLALKVGTRKLEIKSDKTLFGLFCALRSFLRNNKPKRKKELIDGAWEETNSYDIDIDKEYLFSAGKGHLAEEIKIPETYRISYFAKYMKGFLDPFKTTNRDWHISRDKWLLTSRIVYIIGYSTNVLYNKRKKDDHATDEDFLKKNYKKDRYKDEVLREIYV